VVQVSGVRKSLVSIMDYRGLTNHETAQPDTPQPLAMYHISGPPTTISFEVMREPVGHSRRWFWFFALVVILPARHITAAPISREPIAFPRSVTFTLPRMKEISRLIRRKGRSAVRHGNNRYLTSGRSSGNRRSPGEPVSSRIRWSSFSCPRPNQHYSYTRASYLPHLQSKRGAHGHQPLPAAADLVARTTPTLDVSTASRTASGQQRAGATPPLATPVECS